jgi:DHA1 family inner membrane transport protein
MQLRPPLLALAAGGFGIGTTEFVIMGLLPQVARDLDVSIPQAGLLVTGYAFGVVVGAPILAIVTAKLPRRETLIGLMAIFILGNLCCVLAPTYGLVLAARVFTAFAHAAFFGIGAVVAADLVPRHERAQAMALMFMGLTLANVLGVPGGTALGQAYGWRLSFIGVALIGLIALFGLWFYLPRIKTSASISIFAEFRVLGEPQVVLGMAMSALSAASLFAVFTYIAPLLTEVSGIPASGVTFVLLLIGVGLTLGNFLGGRLADWRLMPSLITIFALLALIQILFVKTSHNPVTAIATLMLWAVIAFAAVPPLQMRVVVEAMRAPNLASTLNQGGFNIGCASGAWLGSIGISHGLAYDRIPLISSALAVAALVLAVISYALDGRKPVSAAMEVS